MPAAAAAEKKPPRAAPASVGALLSRIGAETASLSRQLKLIARHVETHRDLLGLEKIQDVAERCGVHPSAVVRFAKHFGYSGYSELQKVFRDGISKQIAPSRHYQARIRSVIDTSAARLSSADIARGFMAGAIDGLQALQRDLQPAAFGRAVELLALAPTIWVVGARRSFPVAAYLAYALQHTDKPVQLVAGIGSMNEGQFRGLRPGDVMIAVSFAPYAAETASAVQLADARQVRRVVITDSRMSPLAAGADGLLLVEESSSFGFRALTNAMAMAQSLFIALAYRLELADSSQPSLQPPLQPPLQPSAPPPAAARPARRSAARRKPAGAAAAVSTLSDPSPGTPP